jgi:glycerol-3-phosphate dehydrogenase (NAD(P)+)
MKRSKANVAIIGAGAIGQAVAASLESHCTFSLWDKTPGLVPDQKELREIAAAADIIFLCVPSSAIRESVEAIKSTCKPEAIVVSLAKGIEAETGERASKILSGFFPEYSYALLGGPMLAEEMKDGKGAVAIIASHSFAAYQKVSEVFKKEFIKLEYSNDLRSVAYAGILKNIYAMIIGLVDGLGYGNNIKGYFSGKIFAELALVAERLELDKEIVFGIAGIDDFIATAFSPNSLNEQAGKQLAKGLLPPKSEGLASLPQVIKDLKELNKLNVLQLLEAIIINHKDPKETIDGYLYHC